MHTRPHKLRKVNTQLLGVKRPKSGRWVSNSEENLRAILNLRPTFPSGGIDITDMISEFGNEALVGFQEIFLLGFFKARFKVWDGPPGPQHGPMGRKSAFPKCKL